ncbi:MAG: tRNA adenosine(34) deaminase TadA [Firmicutes bacterium]|nr:tRNA adenosine(34) deaminase TadA [Bacillota bacterium]
MDNLFYMQEAYNEALKAYKINEVPIGCVIVHQQKIIARAFNLRTAKKNVLYHAEILAIDAACKYINDWRLEECCLYVTVEPCAMCAGAILQARIPTLVYAAASPKAGCAGSIINLLDNPYFNHQVDIISGVLQQECTDLMQNFFREFRQK